MTIGVRFLSALLLMATMGFLYWLVPNFEPATVGATTPDRIALFFTGLFALFWVLSRVTRFHTATSAVLAPTTSTTSFQACLQLQHFLASFFTLSVFGECRL